MLKTGIKTTAEEVVCEKNTAKTLGSGTLDVYATPAMITLMEKTSAMLVAEFLAAGEGTVGTRVDVRHTNATPLGMGVRCESELVEIDRKRLLFKVSAYDTAGLIGEGTHERFIINNEAFLEKVYKKGAPQ